MLRWYVWGALIIGTTAASIGSAQQTCPTPASSFERIQRGIFEPRCNQGYCHGSAARGGLDLRADVAYANLLREHDADAAEPSDELEPVDPGHADESLLWLKLAAKTLGRKHVPGDPMPIGGLALSPDELEGIRLWIEAGAPETGIVDGVADLVSPCVTTSPDDATVPPPCDPRDRDLLLPDLVVDPPSDISVISKNDHRWIEFTTAVGNAGNGPLIVQAATPPTAAGQVVDAVQIIQRADGSQCSHPAGVITYKSSGGHWAYQAFASFEVRKDDPLNGPVVARADKSAFCLLDTTPFRGSEGNPHQFEAHCEDAIGRMGISVGYKDVYDRVYPEQWIDLDTDPNTTVPAGTYYLVNLTNPGSTLLEVDSSREDNLNYIRVAVRFDDPQAPAVVPTRTPRLPHSPPTLPTRTPRLPHTRPAPPSPTPTPTLEPPPTPQPSPTMRGPHAPHRPREAATARPRHEPRPTRTPR
jgi:hypothetical protein